MERPPWKRVGPAEGREHLLNDLTNVPMPRRLHWCLLGGALLELSWVPLGAGTGAEEEERKTGGGGGGGGGGGVEEEEDEPVEGWGRRRRRR